MLEGNNIHPEENAENVNVYGGFFLNIFFQKNKKIQTAKRFSPQHAPSQYDKLSVLCQMRSFLSFLEPLIFYQKVKEGKKKPEKKQLRNVGIPDIIHSFLLFFFLAFFFPPFGVLSMPSRVVLEITLFHALSLPLLLTLSLFLTSCGWISSFFLLNHLSAT